MTDKTLREHAVEKIATTLSELYGRSMEVHKREARLIIDELESFGYVQKDPGQSLPENHYKLTDRERRLHLYDDKPMVVYSEAQQDMREAGWVKVKKE